MFNSIWVNIFVAALFCICVVGWVVTRRFYKKRMKEKEEYERLAKKATQINRRNYIMKASRSRRKRH